jgi:hypothetical protein
MHPSDHHPVGRAQRVRAVHMTLRRWGEGQQWPQPLLLPGQRRTHGSKPSLARRLGNGKQKERSKDQGHVPETDATHPSTRAAQTDEAGTQRLRGRYALDVRGKVQTLVLEYKKYKATFHMARRLLAPARVPPHHREPPSPH